MKNKTQLDGMPVWFDGKSINEALFCEEFLQTHKIIFTNGAFFTPEGRVTDELPLRGEIFEELKCCAVSNIGPVDKKQNWGRNIWFSSPILVYSRGKRLHLLSF